MNLTGKKWTIIISSGIMILLILLFLFFFYVKNGATEQADQPGTQQRYYSGVITEIIERNTEVGGVMVLYTIKLDEGSIHAITEHSTVYKIIKNNNNPNSPKVREKTELSEEMMAGKKAELWERQVNERFEEVYEVTVE